MKRLFPALLLLPALASPPALAAEGEPLPACSACGQNLTGEYLSTAVGEFHPAHFLCAGCELPIEGSAYVVREGAPWCRDCYSDRFVAHCPICDAPLRGTVLQDAWGNRFCSRHASEYPPCDSCGRRVCLNLTGGGAPTNDGRVVCNLCRGTAVGEEGGKALLGQVAAFLREKGLTGADDSLPFRLVTLSDLAGEQSRSSKPVRGRTNTLTTTADGVSRTVVEAIWILSGLPREEFAAVAAHELVHAHLVTAGFPPLTGEVEEGLCELGSYLWLRSRTDPFAEVLVRRLQENRTGTYGKGFQLALNAWRRNGLPRLMQTVRETGNLP